ncbi:MAG: FprA family A-type flavoprotein [Candidatus Eisenbacteria bacterium]|nr:FprA family A-type flavoprotein [Candidatus Eisenbacteria bacterium]
MAEPFRAVRISERVFWVGAIDWSIRDFHGYATNRGTTYNAYLVMADEIALVDTVKAPFRDEFMSRIRSVVDPRDIKVIVSNHSEMDHSGLLPQTVKAVEPREVLASPMGVKALAEHFHGLAGVTAVKDGERRSLGNATLTFYETRMLHWPDSMISYLDGDEVLFSQDAFGMHLASSERFDDELDPALLNEEAAKYYANILMPYSGLVTKALDRLGSLKLPAKLVAPDHGPVWRRGFAGILASYARWAEQRPTRKAVVVYDTMWGSTAAMARAIGDGLAAGGASANLLPLSAADRSEAATEVLEAGALLVGSSTLNGQMLPTVADILTYLKGLKPANLVGQAFGSYGWSGEAVQHVQDALVQMKVDMVGEAQRCRYVPTGEHLASCRALGELVAARLP